MRRRVEPNSPIPTNWDGFLRVDENKKELFRFLAATCSSADCFDKKVMSSYDQSVVSNTSRDIGDLSPCTHEEADTRIFVQCLDSVGESNKRLLIRTVDTDLAVIAISLSRRLSASEIWIAFRSGKAFRYIEVHKIAAGLGPEKTLALPAFHALTGCDQVLSFYSKGKKTAWDTWNVYEDVTPAFSTLSNNPNTEAVYKSLPLLASFVVLMYDRTSSCVSANKARLDLFPTRTRMDAIPPTYAALLQHVKRAAYMAGHCWGQALIASPNFPSPSEWAWQQSSSGQWEPVSTPLPEVSKVCELLLKCSCQPEMGCKGRCKCVKSLLPCTALCM